MHNLHAWFILSYKMINWIPEPATLYLSNLNEKQIGFLCSLCLIFRITEMYWHSNTEVCLKAKWINIKKCSSMQILTPVLWLGCLPRLPALQSSLSSGSSLPLSETTMDCSQMEERSLSAFLTEGIDLQMQRLWDYITGGHPTVLRSSDATWLFQARFHYLRQLAIQS